MESTCRNCKQRFRWRNPPKTLCAPCRRKLSKPIETICANCGRRANALFCYECSKPLLEWGKKLIDQERWNQLTPSERKKRGLENPQYSQGEFPSWLKEEEATKR